MIIAGLDYSATSPAIVLMELDKDYEITKATYKAIAKTKKQVQPNKVIQIDKELGDIARYICTGDHIFSSEPEYVAFEDYAFGASGALTKLAEAVAYQKALCFKAGMKIRLYDIASHKKCYTEHGNSDKLSMWDQYEKGTDWLCLKNDIKAGKLPEVETGKGASPTSDIVDAFSVAECLRLELKLRAGIIMLKDLPEHQRSIFLRVTKSAPVNLLDTPFESK